MIDQIFPFIFIAFWFLIVGLVVFSFISSAKNRKLPKIKTEAKCVKKRISHSKNSTSFYVTFLFPLGDQTEFRVTRTEYNSINEGDSDDLVFQGFKFISFGFISNYKDNESFDSIFSKKETKNDECTHSENAADKQLEELDEKFDDYFDKSRY